MGKLWVVPTPIGNLGDMTFRALEVLRSADLVACEDTRRTRALLSHFGVTGKRLLSLHAHNEEERAGIVSGELERGASVALVSDSGTPGISDPGSLLIRALLERGFEVEVLPGPVAFVPALLLSGLNPSSFLFVGFPPKRRGERLKRLKSLSPLPFTLVLYVSPHDVEEVLEDALLALGDRRCALCRELTKVHQQVFRGRLSELLSSLEEEVPRRGEMVLVLEGAAEKPQGDDRSWKDLALALLKEGLRPSRVARVVSSHAGVNPNEIKRFLHELSQDEGEQDSAS